MVRDTCRSAGRSLRPDSAGWRAQGGVQAPERDVEEARQLRQRVPCQVRPVRGLAGHEEGHGSHCGGPERHSAQGVGRHLRVCELVRLASTG